MLRKNTLALSLRKVITGLEAGITNLKEIVINYPNFSVRIMKKSSVHVLTDVHYNYTQYVYLSHKNIYSTSNTWKVAWHFCSEFGLNVLIMHMKAVIA